MRFENPDTGEEFEIDYTVELGQSVAEARGPECDHARTEIRGRTVQGGGVQIKPQCLLCGLPIGKPLPKALHPDASQFDEALLKSVQDDEKRRVWGAAIKYREMFSRRELEYQQQYDRYLQSPQWMEKRTLVLKRSEGICEGCMLRKASQVHHLTYKHFGDELLFELVALCQICHEKVHFDLNSDEHDELPCRGCRYQGDGIICPVFGVSEHIALSDQRYCGPKRSAFEPLK